MQYLVVSPSVRAFPPEYYSAVKDLDILIVDDADGKADRSRLNELPNVIYADTKFCNSYIGDKHRIKSLIPHHNPSCKNFGLYYAWKEKYDVVVLLDDDCDTSVNPSFVEQIPINKPVTAMSFVTDSGWINTLRCIDDRFVARGYPYEYRTEKHDVYAEIEVTPKFNQGMWFGTPDINGIDKLLIDPEMINPQALLVEPDVDFGYHTKIPYTAVLRGQRMPCSIMNVQIARELIPAFYQPPDYDVWNGMKIRRHDDVWSAYFLKRIMDEFADEMTFGEPVIYHRKAGNAIKEVLSEHNTNLIQPYIVNAIDNNICTGRSYAEKANSLALNALFALTKKQIPSPLFYNIVLKYLKACAEWAEEIGKV